jgi:hypothetical protein
VIVAGVWWVEGGTLPASLSLSPSASPSVSASKSPVSGIRRTATPAPTSTASYTQLVQQFGSNRIQFDNRCQAQPNSVVFKNGAQIMLDNRSSQARNISLNGTSYALAGYGYKIVTLSSATLPKQISLGCNSLVNVGVIQLEANISGQ